MKEKAGPIPISWHCQRTLRACCFCHRPFGEHIARASQQ